MMERGRPWLWVNKLGGLGRAPLRVQLVTHLWLYRTLEEGIGASRFAAWVGAAADQHRARLW
jgi:hypothetical protein